MVLCYILHISTGNTACNSARSRILFEFNIKTVATSNRGGLFVLSLRKAYLARVSSFKYASLTMRLIVLNETCIPTGYHLDNCYLGMGHKIAFTR